MEERMLITEPTDVFNRFAKKSATVVGSPWTFVLANVVIAAWVVTGPLFHYSDTWQLSVNTITTVMTFLTVFLIQNTQNRDARAIHLKLDELIHKLKGARNALIDLENCTEEELDRFQQQFKKLKRSDTATAPHR